MTTPQRRTIAELANTVHHMPAARLAELLPDNSVDLLIPDPPYQRPDDDGADDNEAWGIAKCQGGFTEQKKLRELPRYNRGAEGNREYQDWIERQYAPFLRALKPGGMLVSFCATKTVHRQACGIEDAGYEIRDQWAYAYPGAMPTGLRDLSRDVARLAPELAGDWEDWKNIVRPAYEPIVIARKPLEKGLTMAENMVKWGTSGGFYTGDPALLGKLPSSILLFEDGLFDGFSKFFFSHKARPEDRDLSGIYEFRPDVSEDLRKPLVEQHGRDFFFEDEIGYWEQMLMQPLKNEHPTVKNTDACQVIVSRVARPGAVVVDFMAGSGSNLVGALRHGCTVIGADKYASSVRVANARIMREMRAR
jgi:site-specific DNA-methyltransferase (adenine-specific)